MSSYTFPKVEAICETCKHYEYCSNNDPELWNDDTCNDWEDKVDREAQRDDAGDREAHRIMVEGRIE